MNRTFAATLIALMLTFWAGVAQAQTHGCTMTPTDGGFTLDCDAYTPTPEPTATSTATATHTLVASTATPTATPTSTPVPPTATSTPVPPTNTATPVAATSTPTPAPVPGLRVNVPVFAVEPGDPLLDANNRAIIWAGDIADDGAFFQLRLVGSNAGLHLYTQQMRRYPQAGERVTVALNGKEFSTAYKQPGAWTQSERCGDGECRGWSGSVVIPWAELGGMPNYSAVWTLSAKHLDAEWTGAMYFATPARYEGALVPGAVVLSVPLSADATLGGSTDCGANAWPSYFPT